MNHTINSIFGLLAVITLSAAHAHAMTSTDTNKETKQAQQNQFTLAEPPPYPSPQPSKKRLRRPCKSCGRCLVKADELCDQAWECLDKCDKETIRLLNDPVYGPKIFAWLWSTITPCVACCLSPLALCSICLKKTASCCKQKHKPKDIDQLESKKDQ